MEFKFEVEDPDGRKCAVCKDPIFTPQMHVGYYVSIQGWKKEMIALCNHCYYLDGGMDKKED